jgi:O-antigen/teichoic acid export membrane protein
MKKLMGKLRGFSFFDTFRHASIYFSGTILIQGLGIISLPIFTYFLSTGEYGLVNVYLSYAAIAPILFSLNLHWSITRYYLEPESEIKGFLASTFLASSLSFFVLSLPVIIYSNEIANFIRLPSETIIPLLLLSYASIIWSFYSNLKIAQKKSKTYTLVQVIFQYLKFALSVVGLWYWGKGVSDIYMGKIWGELLGAALICIWLLWSLFPLMDFKAMRKSHLQYALKFSIPLIPYALGGYILASFDAWIINIYCGNSDAGLYSFAYKLGTLLLGLILALQNASIVEYTGMMDEKKHEAINAQAQSIHRLTILAALLLILFSVDAGTVLSGKASFRTSLSLVPVIAGGYIFYGIATLYSRVFNYLKINIYLTYIVLIACAVNAGLNLYLIPIYNYQAAAYTTLASYALMAFLAWFVTAIWLKIPSPPIGKQLLPLLPILVITLLYYGLGWQNIGMHWGIIALKLLVVGLFALGLFHKTIKRILLK